MPAQELPGTTALVTGASRGFGRAITIALSKHGAHVVGVARDRARLEELHAQLGGTFTPVAADAADPVVAGQLLGKHRPRTLVLNAGAPSHTTYLAAKPQLTLRNRVSERDAIYFPSFSSPTTRFVGFVTGWSLASRFRNWLSAMTWRLPSPNSRRVQSMGVSVNIDTTALVDVVIRSVMAS